MKSPQTGKLIRNLTLRQLQIFDTVVRVGGITRAAEALHLSQPTVSMQVRKMSETLGLELLEHVGRRVHPTAAGQEVFETAQDILESINSLGDLAAELKSEVKGELRVSVITTATYFMPHLFGAFIERHPDVVPKLTITNRAEVLERLKSNIDDLLIMGQVPSELAVQAHPFIDNELVVVAPPDHPLAKERNISLDRLAQERFLARESGSGTRLAVDRLFDREKIQITPYMELGSAEAIKQGVMAGLGVSVLSRLSLSLELESRKIAILDVEEFPLVRRWYAVHLRDKKLSLVTRTFLDYILKESGTILSTQPRDRLR